jgi:hypothetical protein
MAALAACRGGGAAPRGTVTIPVIVPTVPSRVCQNTGYPADAPQFGDNASFAYREVAVPLGRGASGTLRYFDHIEGAGPSPAADAVVQVNYTGWLNKDCIFDTTYTDGEAVQFPLNGVIPGWRDGIATMKVGGKRRLEIPPELAYGPVGVPPVIPPNTTLIFEVELLGTLTPPEATATMSVEATATATVREATATARAATATAQAAPGTPASTPEAATPTPVR